MEQYKQTLALVRAIADLNKSLATTIENGAPYAQQHNIDICKVREAADALNEATHCIIQQIDQRITDATVCSAAG